MILTILNGLGSIQRKLKFLPLTYNGEVVKYVTNKEIINEEVNVNNAISEKAEISHDKKVAYVEIMDKKATIQNAESVKSDEIERLNAKKGIENVYTDVQETAIEGSHNLEGNSTTLKDVARTIEADKNAWP